MSSDSLDSPDDDDLLPEYDFDYSKARPNRFAASLPSGNRIVSLDPDIAKVFPDAESVNAVLRALISTCHGKPAERHAPRSVTTSSTYHPPHATTKN